MSRIILTAENFAFGPVGKILNLADFLKEKGHVLGFAGFGTSYQLARDYGFDDIYEIDTDDDKSVDLLKTIIEKYDLLISSMDLSSVKVAKSIGKPVVWVDCLFWFWESIFEPLFDIDLFIAERSLSYNANESKFSSQIRNFCSVGPILPRIKKMKRKRQVLISYGGGEAAMWYRNGKDTNYSEVLTGILSKSVDWSYFDRVVVTTNEKILKDLSLKFCGSRFEFTTCGSHSGFLNEMVQSEILLTTAGLITSQEAFMFETPVIYLPPSNNSHYILQDELLSMKLGLASVHLADFLPRLILRGKPEDVSIAEVMSQLRMVESSVDLQKRIGENINQLISSRLTWSAESIKANKFFLESLGKNGSEAATNKIGELLASKFE